MSKEEITEALKNIKIRCHQKVVWDDPIDFDLDTIEKSLKAIKVLQDDFSFSSYNPNGDYFVISFTIKENCDRKLINETLFGGSEVLKCQKE